VTDAGRLRYNFWISSAEFLCEGFGVPIQDWIKTLEFSVFDKVAPANRDVPWR